MELEQYKKDVEQGKMENLEDQQEARKYVIENFFVSLYLLQHLSHPVIFDFTTEY